MSVNFDEHREHHHNEWNYIFYLYYLSKKGEDELTGLEYHAWSMFKEQKVEWVPIGETLYLKGKLLDFDLTLRSKLRRK
jgi:hypothetical protein